MRKIFKYLSENKLNIREIIEGYKTKAGQRFDLILLVAIILSVIVVMLDSDKSLHEKYGMLFIALEWFFTILFTVEYALRIYVTKNKRAYIFSYMGIVDLLSIIPTYVGFAQLADIRLIRLIRIFKILQLPSYTMAGRQMMLALKRIRPGLVLFCLFMSLAVVAIGTLMYLIEGPLSAQTPGFETIPKSIYWAIVTLTTVGYGNVVPVSVLGKLLASFMMIVAFTTIAVGASVVTAYMRTDEAAKSHGALLREYKDDYEEETKDLVEALDNLREQNSDLKKELGVFIKKEKESKKESDKDE